ncbi:MAG: GntR family transcriptional regulator [Rhodospirillales bacterium]|nr:GntR family transcriptional regulator [Rhodospirillales bacterium]
MDPAPEKIVPNGQSTLHEDVVNKLRELIFDGQLADETRIPEKQLCARFGISRTPLREALKVLAREGLISLLPHRGARVVKLKPSDIDEVFPVMGALEAVAGEAACRNISEEGIAEIRALHYQMALHHTRGERADYFRLNQRIHEKIMEAAGNPTLSQIYKSLSLRIRRARYMANIPQQRWDQAMAEHELILQTLAARDGAKLGQLLKTHLLNKSEVVKATISDSPP